MIHSIAESNYTDFQIMQWWLYGFGAIIVALCVILVCICVVHYKTKRQAQPTKLQDHSLFEAYRDLSTVLDMLPLGVRVANPDDMTLLYLNKALMKTYGYESVEEGQQLVGTSAYKFVPEFQPDGKRSIDLINENVRIKASDWEIHCIRQNGEPFLARVNSTMITYHGMRASLAVVEDMTAEEEYRKMLENAAQKERDANQLKSRFLSNMSHEIRTPMNAILGIAEIQLQNESLSDGTRDALLQIYESGDLLLGIINDILDLSKIEADKLEIIPVEYDIYSLINDAVLFNHLRYENKPVELLLDIDANTPLNLFGDELRIKQVLNNILSNAFKYTEQGEIKLEVWAEPMANEEFRMNNEKLSTVLTPDSTLNSSFLILNFRVTDTGQGMTPEQIELLFDEYTRFNLEVNRTIVGVGLGMSITKRLLNLMGGEICAQSEVGKGSVFTVRLPQRQVGSLVCGSEVSQQLQKSRFQSRVIEKKSQVEREQMPYGRVLVVDDVKSNLYVAKGMLLPYGLQIDSAFSGFEAIDMISSGKEYDIIFMDHMMPKMDGIQAADSIRELGYTRAIVALTANAVAGQAEMFIQKGFDAFISKPIDSRELDAVLNEYIRKDKAP